MAKCIQFYARITFNPYFTFCQQLKAADANYFILPAGLDASAANPKRKAKVVETISEEEFIKRMLTYDPNIFDNVDGWASHSYPNPNFSGRETDTGKGS